MDNGQVRPHLVFSHNILTNVLSTALPMGVCFLFTSTKAVFYYVLLGYLLALIVEACIQFQSTTDHIDPIHITAHYLRATYAALFTICIHSLKTGSGFTNLSAELSQEVVINNSNVTRPLTHLSSFVFLIGYREDNDTCHIQNQRASSQG